MLRRGELLGPWHRCRTRPRAFPDTFARWPSWRPIFDNQSSGRRGQRSAHSPRARGECGVCLTRRRGRVNSRRSSRSADLERRAGPPPGPAGATGEVRNCFGGYTTTNRLRSRPVWSLGRPCAARHRAGVPLSDAVRICCSRFWPKSPKCDLFIGYGRGGGARAARESLFSFLLLNARGTPTPPGPHAPPVVHVS